MGRLKSFSSLTFRGQVARCKRLAISVLKASYPHVIAPKLELLVHGENTTFKVTDTVGTRFVLRIHRPDYQTTEAIRAELDWLDWLRTTESFPAPVALPNLRGELLSFGEQPGVGQRRCVLFSWIDGDHKRQVPLASYTEMGRLLGVIHRSSHKVPDQIAKARRWLGDLRCFTMDWDLYRGDLSPSKIRQIKAAISVVNDDLKARQGDPAHCGLIHSDMHLGNVLFGPAGQVSVIDFDDAMRAPFLYGFATAYLSVEPDKPTTPHGAWEALLSGYEGEFTLPKRFEQGLALYCAARKINMTEWLLERRDNSEIFEHFPRYTENLEETLAGYLSVWADS